ncbi:MAG: hypothetical protein E6Q97_37150 [Desulfurellales bacterium]|nr:MAG: hypothetical protein E6Q97_37150 [Desulfurellales bacterium]
MSKKVQPPTNAPAPGLDAEDHAPADTVASAPDAGGGELQTTESKEDREFGRLPFQPTCQKCTNETGTEVKMVNTRSEGPLAYYQCKRCGARIKQGRPWKPKPTGHSAPNVAARQNMNQ